MYTMTIEPKDSGPKVALVGHDLAVSGRIAGSGIPLTSFFEYMVEKGHTNFNILNVRNKSAYSQAEEVIKSSDVVVLNGLGVFTTGIAIPLLNAIANKPVFMYLHETEYTANASEARFPERMSLFWRNLPYFNLLCCTERQLRWYRSQTDCVGDVIYNTFKSSLPRAYARPLTGHRRIEVINVATVQDRKGPQLFSEVADLANKLELDRFNFTWVGRKTDWIDQDFEFGNNVNWIDHLPNEQVHELLSKSDVYFLSSIDDPLPLSVGEAAHKGLRLVTYKAPGSNELFFGTPGYEYFTDYDSKSALNAINRVINIHEDEINYDKQLELLSVESFSSRLNLKILNTDKAIIYPGPKVVDILYSKEIFKEISGEKSEIERKNKFPLAKIKSFGEDADTNLLLAICSLLIKKDKKLEAKAFSKKIKNIDVTHIDAACIYINILIENNLLIEAAELHKKCYFFSEDDVLGVKILQRLIARCEHHYRLGCKKGDLRRYEEFLLKTYHFYRSNRIIIRKIIQFYISERRYTEALIYQRIIQNNVKFNYYDQFTYVISLIRTNKLREATTAFRYSIKRVVFSPKKQKQN